MSALKLSRQEARKIRQLLRQLRSCLLRDAYPPAYQGIFIPDKPKLWGGKPGKVRLLGYALCAPCSAMPALTLHVERRLRAGLVGSCN
jgi:hypothetical protein